MRLHFGDDVDEDELGAPVNVRGGGGVDVTMGIPRTNLVV
jgi:hypothetical protein